jgi:hypothetical protein
VDSDALNVLNELARFDRHREIRLLVAATRGKYIGFSPGKLVGNHVISGVTDGLQARFATNANQPSTAGKESEGVATEIDTYTTQLFDVVFDADASVAPRFSVLTTLDAMLHHISHRVFLPLRRWRAENVP